MCSHARLPTSRGDADCDWMRLESLIRVAWSAGSDPIRLVARLPGTSHSPAADSVLKERRPRYAEARPRRTAIGLGESALLVRSAVHHHDRASTSS